MNRPPQVWLSRPAGRAAPLAKALSAVGVAPCCVPAIEIVPAADSESLAVYLRAPQDWDLHVVVSAHAAELLRDRLPPGAPLSALAVGTATAAALPPRYQLAEPPDGLNEEVNDSARLLSHPCLQAPRTVAVLGGAGARRPIPSARLCRALTARGGEVLPVVCYRRAAAEKNPALSRAGQGGALAAAVAFSGDSLRAMQAMTAPDNGWLYRLPLFVIHRNIAATARRAGFQNVITVSASGPNRFAQQIRAIVVGGGDGGGGVHQIPR